MPRDLKVPGAAVADRWTLPFSQWQYPEISFTTGLTTILQADMSSLSSSPSLDPLFAFLAYSLVAVQRTFNSIPGSAIVARYVASSYQNDPGRSVLELILVIFALRTLMKSRTGTRGQKSYVKFSEKVC